MLYQVLWQVIYEKNGDRRFSPSFRTEEQANELAEQMRARASPAKSLPITPP